MTPKHIATVVEFAANFIDPAKFTPCRIAGVTDLVEALNGSNVPVDARDQGAVRFSIVGAASKGFEVAGITRKDGNWETLFEVLLKTLIELFPDLAPDPFACSRKQALAAIHVIAARLSPDDAAGAAVPASAPPPAQPAAAEAPAPIPVTAAPPPQAPPPAPVPAAVSPAPTPRIPTAAPSLVPKPPANPTPLKLSTTPGPKA